jgi:predicted DNA-binding transcriptional regulator AlpA
MDNTYFSSKQLEARFQRSPMTLHRWLADPELNFPEPMYIRGRRYWSVEEIEAWEKSRATAEVS